ncbi:Glycosyltransferase involved in cell wall bisynthesis [Actinokineospora alba]|uniref:Glycosyltransferase involved in cell wall bisynthesis n=1 Tax=Actinokineospora alba TaxID=504798 RepID=A0A1H0NDG8_9PSEU|nr:glycosyltransferase family 4 protein [Actinokineospora alba]TDP68683.1 glycosyltransferase involved in cell wall biosynthesis [Actinokineospora alba]SDH84475.1 Glycosyltransferase involved in cell wall bisynthesis [Actinokineospora alba]SDO90799.1 Glycosyltransferase involved in cell wall bisynthesis [Actinokineospora alba]
MNAVHVVLPGGVDDPATPSGGNVYDRRVCRGLVALGVAVHEVAVPGAWPSPDTAARAELAGALAAIADGSVVLLDGLVACGVPEVVVPHAGRLRLVVLVHLPLADETGLSPELASALDAAERQTLRAARAVVTTSPWATRRLVEHHGLTAVHTVTPGTDPAPTAPGTEAGTRLLCVASVTPRKGHDLLVEALAAVADLPWTCVCVGPLGDPGYVEDLRLLIERHHLADRVTLDGPRSGGSLDRAYASADLLVLASRAETYGMVVAEALARGIPVLATAVSGVPDTLGQAPAGGTPGLLVPPGDTDALAAALRRWLADPDLRRDLRRSARARGEALRSWDDCAQDLAGVLARLGG